MDYSNETFILLNKVEKTVDYINKQLISYPRYESVIKNNIEEDMYKLIELIFSYRIENVKRIRIKYLKDIVIKLSMLDYYMKVSFNKKILGISKYKDIGIFITDIRKITYGIIRNEKI